MQIESWSNQSPETAYSAEKPAPQHNHSSTLLSSKIHINSFSSVLVRYYKKNDINISGFLFTVAYLWMLEMILIQRLESEVVGPCLYLLYLYLYLYIFSYIPSITITPSLLCCHYESIYFTHLHQSLIPFFTHYYNYDFFAFLSPLQHHFHLSNF